jgi:hypothetical protein
LLPNSAVSCATIAADMAAGTNGILVLL